MIYFAKETGGIYLEPYTQLPDDYDARERSWYINTKKRKLRLRYMYRYE